MNNGLTPRGIAGTKDCVPEKDARAHRARGVSPSPSWTSCCCVTYPPYRGPRRAGIRLSPGPLPAVIPSVRRIRAVRASAAGSLISSYDDFVLPRLRGLGVQAPVVLGDEVRVVRTPRRHGAAHGDRGPGDAARPL